MKNFLNALYSILESIDKAKTAAYLTRCGMHQKAKALMMNQWQPMTDEDWEWVNHGTLPKPVDIPVKTNYN